MMTNDDIKARIAELQAGAAAKAEVTLETILAELADAAAVAKDRGQAQALVSAAMSKAKLLGLDIQRIEVGGPGDFGGLTSTAQIVDKVLERLVEQFKPIDQGDRAGLIALYERHLQETEEYLASIRARPIVAERIDARNLARPWNDYEPFQPRSPQQRIGYQNGKTARQEQAEREAKVVRED